MPDEATWDDVIATILRRWPTGPGNKQWDVSVLRGYVNEMEGDGMQPAWALRGLRASLSDFIPSVGGVKRLYRESLPPMTAVQIEEAAERQAERRLEAADDEPRGLTTGGES